MPSNAERLAKCFSLVFPSLSADEIGRATVSSVPEWDSLANINLICVIEEEFSLALEASDLEELSSFDLVLDHIESRVAKGS
jgi:acyl carrier protein